MGGENGSSPSRRIGGIFRPDSGCASLSWRRAATRLAGVLTGSDWELCAQALNDPHGVWSLDASEFPKKGTASVGVAHQYCGALGKTANCQSGVFLCYSSAKGHALLDSRLYLPKSWFEPSPPALSHSRGYHLSNQAGTRARTAPTLIGERPVWRPLDHLDRKSTRLNSSHLGI